MAYPDFSQHGGQSAQVTSHGDKSGLGPGAGCSLMTSSRCQRPPAAARAIDDPGSRANHSHNSAYAVSQRRVVYCWASSLCRSQREGFDFHAGDRAAFGSLHWLGADSRAGCFASHSFQGHNQVHSGSWEPEYPFKLRGLVLGCESHHPLQHALSMPVNGSSRKTLRRLCSARHRSMR